VSEVSYINKILPKQSQNSLTGPSDEAHGSQFEVRLVHMRLLDVQNTV